MGDAYAYAQQQAKGYGNVPEPIQGMRKRALSMMNTPAPADYQAEADPGMSTFDRGLAASGGRLMANEDTDRQRLLGQGMLSSSEDWRQRSLALKELMRRKAFLRRAEEENASKDAFKKVLGAGAGAIGTAVGGPLGGAAGAASPELLSMLGIL